MWKLYDDLYIGIPSGITIDGCIIGDKWVTVRANGNIGVARMLEKPCLDGKDFIGAYLRDTGCHLRWDSLTRAAVGVAALNKHPVFGYYLSRIHTPRDTVLREENIAFLAEGARKLASSL